jgi:hypothetical protein
MRRTERARLVAALSAVWRGTSFLDITNLYLVVVLIQYSAARRGHGVEVLRQAECDSTRMREDTESAPTVGLSRLSGCESAAQRFEFTIGVSRIAFQSEGSPRRRLSLRERTTAFGVEEPRVKLDVCAGPDYFLRQVSPATKYDDVGGSAVEPASPWEPLIWAAIYGLTASCGT